MWLPKFDKRSGPKYRAIVNALRNDIAKERLEPGSQLPTQRALADALGITVSTVTRAYSEAKRVGLIDGEVGRGTYVRQSSGDGVPSSPNAAARGENDHYVDRMINRPVLAGLDVHLRDALGRLQRQADLVACLDYPQPGGDERHRAAGVSWMARAGVKCTPSDVTVCNGAQQALLVALATHCSRGDCVATERLNSPGIRRIADFLGLHLYGLPLDEEGLEPDAFADACTKQAFRAVICTPSNQNPTTGTMSVERRRHILEIALANDITVIEDDVQGPLLGGKLPTLYTLSGGATTYVSSLSKAVAPGLRFGFLVSGVRGARHRFAQLVHTSTWGVSPLIGTIVSDWIERGVVDQFVEHHLRQAKERVTLARSVLKDASLRSSLTCYHAWLEPPSGMHVEDFTTSLRMRNVAATPGSWFSIDGSPVCGVRLNLGTESDLEKLRGDLVHVADIIDGGATAPLV